MRDSIEIQKQSLLWWAVDYNQVAAIRLLLAYPHAASLGTLSLSSDQELSATTSMGATVETLRDALAWSTRKNNTECAVIIEDELVRRAELALGSSPQSTENNNSFPTHSDEDAAEIIPVHQNPGTSPSPNNKDQEEEESEILARLESIRLEQERLASKLEHCKARNQLDFQVVSKELEIKRSRFEELNIERKTLEEAVELSRDEFDVAKALYESASEHLKAQEKDLAVTEIELEAVSQELTELERKRATLEGALKRFDATKAGLIVVDSIGIVMQDKVAEDRSASSSKSSAGKHQIESLNSRLLECPICRDEQVSASFQCGHAFCRSCVDKLQAIDAAFSSSSNHHDGTRSRRGSSSSSSSTWTSSSSFASFFSRNQPPPQPVGDDLRCPVCKSRVHSIHPLFLSSGVVV